MDLKGFPFGVWYFFSVSFKAVFSLFLGATWACHALDIHHAIRHHLRNCSKDLWKMLQDVNGNSMGKSMEKILEHLQEIQQAVDLLKDFSTIFDLDGMFFLFSIQRCSKHQLFSCNILGRLKIVWPQKILKKFHINKTIKRFKTPIFGRFQQSIISYRLKSWRLTTGRAPLLEPSLARTKSTLTWPQMGSLVCVRKVNLALGQYEGIRYTCITVSLSSHMSGNILTLIISSFKFQWFWAHSATHVTPNNVPSEKNWPINTQHLWHVESEVSWLVYSPLVIPPTWSCDQVSTPLGRPVKMGRVGRHSSIGGWFIGEDSSMMDGLIDEWWQMIYGWCLTTGWEWGIRDEEQHDFMDTHFGRNLVPQNSLFDAWVSNSNLQNGQLPLGYSKPIDHQCLILDVLAGSFIPCF